jgi:hypothetical protein
MGEIHGDLPRKRDLWRPASAAAQIAHVHPEDSYDRRFNGIPNRLCRLSEAAAAFIPASTFPQCLVLFGAFTLRNGTNRIHLSHLIGI